jgi:hypothetical protein
MLRTNFTHGMANLTMIIADEWVGMVLTLLVHIRTEIGFNITNESGAFGKEDIVVDLNSWPDDGMLDEGKKASIRNMRSSLMSSAYVMISSRY